METADIGLIGLAVMGENLALNFEGKGYAVAVYNRRSPGREHAVDRFVEGVAAASGSSERIRSENWSNR